ncbi:lipoyl(octanoyl) transferase LipB [bacterium]|nr:lipoyl(octanoyl) transferase LipB [bacterium]
MGLRRQYEAVSRVKVGGMDEVLFFEHLPVVTLGRATPQREEPKTIETRKNGLALLRARRGGRATWHGRGQIVGYPIIDLKRRRLSPSALVSVVGESLVQWIREAGTDATFRGDNPAITLQSGKKVGSVGMALLGHLSLHGFSLNIRGCDSPPQIRPCGKDSQDMTSINGERKEDLSLVARRIGEILRGRL